MSKRWCLTATDPMKFDLRPENFSDIDRNYQSGNGVSLKRIEGLFSYGINQIGDKRYRKPMGKVCRCNRSQFARSQFAFAGWKRQNASTLKTMKARACPPAGGWMVGLSAGLLRRRRVRFASVPPWNHRREIHRIFFLGTRPLQSPIRNFTRHLSPRK